jgi:hypothetical protein
MQTQRNVLVDPEWTVVTWLKAEIPRFRFSCRVALAMILDKA